MISFLQRSNCKKYYNKVYYNCFVNLDVMKERLYTILNIKASESNQVFDLLSVQFFIGLANAILTVVALTFFVDDFSPTKLPWVYLVTAFVLLILNFLYEKLEHKFSPLYLLKIVLALTLLILPGIWAGLSFGNEHNFIFILLVSNTIIYMITGYAFWGLLALLFNVRESRRVFSVAGAGDIPAKLVGYLIAGSTVVIQIIGLDNLVWFAIFSFLTGLLLFNRIIRKKNWDNIRLKTMHEKNHEVQAGHKTGFVLFFFKNKLIFTISLLSILSYNVFILIDYTFISEIKHKYNNITDLANFIAVFFAVGRITALIFKLIFTSRVIQRLGIIACLFITPVALLIFCVLFFVFENHSHYHVFIFGIMAMITEVLRSTMQEPVFFILFQPLKEQLRLKGHIIAKGYTFPPSLIVVGISILLFYNWGIPLSILLTIKIILVNLFVWAAVIFLIQKAYLNTLHSSIEKGTFSSDENYIYDQTTINILLNKIKTGKNAEVIYALDLLKKAAYPGLTGLLHEQLFSGETAIRKYAIEQLENTGNAELETLHNLLTKEQDPEVKQKIISTLCKLDPVYLATLSEDFINQEYDTKKTVIINLLNQGEFNYLFKAGSEINNLINSNLPGERLLAISIISELKHVQFTAAITNLINDKDSSVKRSAVMAACKLNISSLLPLVLELSDHSTDKYLVIKALQQYGDALFEDIKALPQDTIRRYTPAFIKISSRIKGVHCKQFLVASLEELDEHTNKTVHSLWVQNYEPAGAKEKEMFTTLLNKYLKMGITKISDQCHIPAYTTEKNIVKNSLVSEIKEDLTLSLKICSLLFRKKQINRILELMEIDQHQKLYNAMEIIEMELPKQISKDLVLLFDFILDPAGNKPVAGKQGQQTLFNKIYFSDSFSYSPWTKAIIIYCAWKNKRTVELKNIVQKKEQQEHYIITETREFVLNN